MSQTVKMSKLAVETNLWPLYEVENGVYRVSYKPKERVPIEEFLKLQVRFKHLVGNPEAVKSIQEFIDTRFNRLLALERATTQV
jgi:pyruvate ferredoxin oxidoreductase beta subunit